MPFRATCDALQGLFLKISPIPRFVECVLPKGGIDPYLTAKYGSEAGPLLLSDSKGHLLHCAIQEGLLDFAKWIDEFAPADGSPGAWILMTFCLHLMFCDYNWQLRKSYLLEMKGSGVVRPWQCGFRDDYGLSGMVDPEAGIALMELYLQEGFLATELSLIFFGLMRISVIPVVPANLTDLTCT